MEWRRFVTYLSASPIDVCLVTLCHEVDVKTVHFSVNGDPMWRPQFEATISFTLTENIGGAYNVLRSTVTGPFHLANSRPTPINMSAPNVRTNSWHHGPSSVVAEAQQETWAIAKLTARCALYMGALKIFGCPWLRPRLLFPKFLTGFCPDWAYKCAYEIGSL